MKNQLKRIGALTLVMMLVLCLPVLAHGTSIIDVLTQQLTQTQPNKGINLIDTEEDEIVAQPTATAEPTKAPVAAPAPVSTGDVSRIRDDANLLTPDEEARLLERIAQFQRNTGMDFLLLTSNKPHPNQSAQQLADDYYDYMGLGLDEENSGVAYYIDMNERYHYLSTTGAMIDYMTDERIDSAITQNTRYLSSGAYYNAAVNMIDMVENYYRKGIPEGQYQYDILTGQQLTARHKALTSNELLVGGLIALVVALIFYKSVSHTYELKGSTYSYDSRTNGSLNMTNTEDTYLNTTTTRVRKPDPPRSNGGFGGGGFSGGSGVHIGSSGTSHGGGGGRF
ncbi:MAG: TPM domain-containing protein [Clostridiales bacterium]|nr:TPM domain-containing protein [Clostridiales bacterium]